jgi:hypothetical protein
MSEPRMEPKKYIETQMRIIEMGKIAASLDIETFLICIRNAETMAPMIDPTLYRRAQNNLEAIKRLAICAKQMQVAFNETYLAVLETAIGYMKNPEPSNVIAVEKK